jgi:hypothetical protein
MTDFEPAPPILVNDSSTPSQWSAAAGQIAPVVGGAIIAFGLLSPAKETAIVGLAPIAVNLVARIYFAWVAHEKLKIAAHAAPDSVAQVVSGKQVAR